MRSRRIDPEVRRRKGTPSGTAQRGGTVVRARNPKLVITSVLAVMAVLCGGFFFARGTARAAFPILPDLSSSTQAVAAHLREADRTARANPHSDVAVGGLCLAYHADMFYSDAERCYRIVADLRPRELRWTYYRALARGELGDTDSLATGMRRVVAAAPHFGQAWWRLGEAEFKAGRYKTAQEAWRRGLSLSDEMPTLPAQSTRSIAAIPSSAYSAFGLARVALVQGDPDGARAILERLTADVPRFGRAFRLLGEAYTLLNRPEDSEKVIRRAARLSAEGRYLDPMVDALALESRNTTFLLQQAAAVDPRTNGAWSEYLARRALSFDPQNPDALYELGTRLQVMGRSREALEILQRHHAIVPEDVAGMAALGGCLVDLGRFSEAEVLLRQALQHVDNAEFRYNLGIAFAGLGRPGEAISAYQRALDRDPTHARASNNLATVLIRQGKLHEAQRLLHNLVAVDAENADAHTNLAVVFLQLGRVDEARREFREAIRVDPQQQQAREALREIGDP